MFIKDQTIACLGNSPLAIHSEFDIAEADCNEALRHNFKDFTRFGMSYISSSRDLVFSFCGC